MQIKDHGEAYLLREASIADSSSISALLQAAKRENLPLDKRQKVGYVQGDMSLESVKRRFASGFGALVAVEKTTGEIVGVNFYSGAPTDTTVEHPLAGVALKLEELEQAEAVDSAGVPITVAGSMMYGPMAVDDSASGHGLARALIFGMKDIAAERGQSRIISFVDQANSASMGMHRHIGLQVLANYEFGPGRFSIFTLNV